MYNINWDKYIQHLVRPVKQKPFRLAWLGLLIALPKKLHTLFLEFRAETLYFTNFRFSKLHMQNLLNNQFDAINQTITIVNQNTIDHTHIYNATEQLPLLLFQPSENQPITLYQPQEHIGAGFIILVPAGIVFSTAQMQALINQYIYTGIDYEIKIT